MIALCDHRNAMEPRQPSITPAACLAGAMLAWSRSRSCGTARLALEDNGHDPSALLWTFLRERPEGSGRELLAFCCSYRFFFALQTTARTVWYRDVSVV